MPVHKFAGEVENFHPPSTCSNFPDKNGTYHECQIKIKPT